MKQEWLDVHYRLSKREINLFDAKFFMHEELAFYDKLEKRLNSAFMRNDIEGRKIAIVSLPEEIENECINCIQLLSGPKRDKKMLIAYARSINIMTLISDLAFLCKLGQAYDVDEVSMHIGSLHELRDGENGTNKPKLG